MLFSWNVAATALTIIASNKTESTFLPAVTSASGDSVKKTMTYKRWLVKEKDLDDAFLVWKHTEEIQHGVQEVYDRFPGLRLTTMGTNDVAWFVREILTPGTHLRQLWNAASRGTMTKPDFSAP